MPTTLSHVNICFHGRLNAQLWQHETLRIPVRLKMLKSAIAFYRFLDVTKLVIKDIIFTGSNAAYNYTTISDLDLHLIVDFSKTACPDLADNFFTTKKTLWNQTYNASIYGHPVELYVEDVTNPVTANGIYSILHNRWLKRPERIKPTAEDTSIVRKAEAYADEIDSLLAGEPNSNNINELLSKLGNLRRNGLLAGGEFSVENLTYKALRSAGFLQKLHDARHELRVKELSLSP